MEPQYSGAPAALGPPSPEEGRLDCGGCSPRPQDPAQSLRQAPCPKLLPSLFPVQFFEYSLEGLMLKLKLKLQYFVHLM